MMASRRGLEANSRRLKDSQQRQQQQQQQQEQQQQQQQRRRRQNETSFSPFPPPSLCWDVVGSPSAWPTAGYKPHRYCFEPGSIIISGEEEEKEGGEIKKTSRIRWSEFTFFDASPECQVTSPSTTTIFAPRSYPPPRQEAEELNPLCRHDRRPAGGVLGSTYKRAIAQGKGHSEAVAEAAEAGALLAKRAREGAEISRAAVAARRIGNGGGQGEVSETNSDPVKLSEQLRSVAEVVGHAMG